MIREDDPLAVVHHLDAWMPETIASFKLRGFVEDVGGEVVESVPGMVRVRLGSPPPAKKAGLLGWLGGRGPVAEPETIHMELHMEQGAARPGELRITMKLSSSAGLFSADGRARCERIGRDLQAYLIGC